MKDKIKGIIESSVLRAHKSKELPSAEFPDIEVEVPLLPLHRSCLSIFL